MCDQLLWLSRQLAQGTGGGKAGSHAGRSQSPVGDVPVWSVSKVYTAGNKVSHKGIIYQAKWWTQGDDPTKGGPWAQVI